MTPLIHTETSVCWLRRPVFVSILAVSRSLIALCSWCTGPFEAWQAQPRLLLFVAELRKAKELAAAYVEVEPLLPTRIG
jgi:hypothetical protein